VLSNGEHMSEHMNEMCGSAEIITDNNLGHEYRE
jgi:hypothetical protein